MPHPLCLLLKIRIFLDENPDFIFRLAKCAARKEAVFAPPAHAHTIGLFLDKLDCFTIFLSK
jgi:hypothetical protein